MTAAERAQRTAAADVLCHGAWSSVGGPDVGAALVAVGGYGRSELAPHSDLDVVLVHDRIETSLLEQVGSQVWYPLWDSGANLDHSVRSLEQMAETAGADLKVALGLLNARHVAGDPNLTLRLRTAMLAQWRRTARERLPELQRMVRTRHELMGELAHVSIPDLKETEGGIRDATVLNALVASWLVDVPHGELEHSRLELLDVRDLVHDIAGRATDRVAPEMWTELAARLGALDETHAQQQVRAMGRRIAYVSRLVWRRVDDVLVRKTSPGAPRRPSLTPIANGVAISGGEVVLDAKARPADDPALLLRAAAGAAERGLVLAPPTAARLARDCPALPTPWPAEARDLLVRLLASGRGLLTIWETLEATGAVADLLPEWERIRLLPHATPIHRFTVDRHVIETCIEASAMIRRVDRPDVLMVAALLHDIGKGSLTEHSVAGEPIARKVAERMGFDAAGVDLIAGLVRWHLLLSETATTRDPDDPMTVRKITERVESVEMLDLLTVLTEADSRAASAKAWSSWRANLILDLSRRAGQALGGTERRAVDDQGPGTLRVEIGKQARQGKLDLTLDEVDDGTRVTAVATDRVGLLADLAGVFVLERLRIRAARAWAQDGYGVVMFDIAEQGIDPARLRLTYSGVAEGRLDPAARYRSGAAESDLAPSVQLRPDASEAAMVLEVRTGDRPGVVHLVCATLAGLDIAVRSAHVDTVGPQAVDVFYLQESAAGALGDERAAQAVHAVRTALAG
jgi:[protein-PII] uridylyltransferase